MADEKNWLEMVGQVAVFRDKEDPKGTAQTGGGVSMDFDQGSAFNLARAIIDDRDLITGSELPSEVFKESENMEATLSQARCKPDFLLFVLSNFFGVCVSASEGPTSFSHTISRLIGTPDHPAFTAVQRRGNSIFKERFVANSINSFTLALGESWITLSATPVGWAVRDVNYFHETVAAPANATQLTLAANSVEGADGAGRLANMYRVRAIDFGDNVFQNLTIGTVSAATPAVLDITTALGTVATDVNYQVDYIPTEPSWCTLPAKITESPLKLTDASIVLDGVWDGSDLTGGFSLGADVLECEVVGENGIEPRMIPDGSGLYSAGETLRGEQSIMVKLTERLRDTVRQYQADNPATETLSMMLRLRGAEIDVGDGVFYGADIVFPKLGILGEPVVVNGRILAQEGDLVVLDDGTYGGVAIVGWNQVTEYLA